MMCNVTEIKREKLMRVGGGYCSCKKGYEKFLISSFRRVLNVVCFLLGVSPGSEFYIPTFQNRQRVPKRWNVKFKRRGIIQKNAYKIVKKF
jgi:hypothetical protein